MYFRKNEETGEYVKEVWISEKLWVLSIPEETWSQSVSKGVSRWVQSVKQGGRPIFRWGTAICTGEMEMGEFQCKHCHRDYKTRSGLWKHEQQCSAITSIVHVPEGEGEVQTQNAPVTTIGINVEAGGTQINNIHNTINIHIRDFGNENPNWLTEGLLYNVIGNMSRAIPLMMQKKHFNEKFPENMNLRLNTKSDVNRRFQVREGGKWRVKDSKQTFYKVVIEIYEILSDALSDENVDEDEEDTHPEIVKVRKSDRFLQKVNRIRPLWEEFREKMNGEENPEIFVELWEDLKTFLLDRKLCVEQE